MKIYGQHDAATIGQLELCVNAEEGAAGVLCADGHVGYSMPIGGVVGYRNFISPSGVGYDIACGNMAVKTTLRAEDFYEGGERVSVADEIARRISFGIGRSNDEKVDDPVFDLIRQSPVKQQANLIQLAQNQLGTVGSGNHYVDILEDEDGVLWIGVHFGSRGFGHKTATMFMNVAKGLDISAKGHDGEMFAPPLLLDVNQPSGQDYIAAMHIAGEYAYAGRRQVVDRVLQILGAGAVDTIHNHHNFAWLEEHNYKNREWFTEKLWVVRKGATPAFPGQRGFVGGSMGDISVILEGVNSDEARESLYSTVHGAGRVMSRNQAIKGKHKWSCPVETEARNYVGTAPDYKVRCDVQFVPPQQRPPKDMKCPVHGVQLVKEQLVAPINFRDVQDRVKSNGTILRGAGPDESPEVYRPLASVLAAHSNTVKVLHTLKPLIVVMAGKEVHDPYKD
jgi:tRNA-splicing ligase RtcB